VSRKIRGNFGARKLNFGAKREYVGGMTYNLRKLWAWRI